MSDCGHYVKFVLSNGNYIDEVFECREDATAACRNYCVTCVSAGCDYCECEEMNREPNVKTSYSCNYLDFMDATPNENYQGPTVIVRGPDPQPIVFTWEGDYYTWRYLEESE